MLGLPNRGVQFGVMAQRGGLHTTALVSTTEYPVGTSISALYIVGGTLWLVRSPSNWSILQQNARLSTL